MVEQYCFRKSSESALAPAPPFKPKAKPVWRLLRLNRNFMNYPLARSMRTRPNWQKDKDGWWCTLPGDDHIELRLPETSRPTLQRCPSGFDMNVLFRLLMAVQENQSKHLDEQVQFRSVAALLRDLHLTADTDNCIRLFEALELWSQLSIRFGQWYEGGQHSVREFPPPIEQVDLHGQRLTLTFNRRWIELVRAKGYYAKLPIPLPNEAASQNLILMLLVWDPKQIDDKMCWTHSWNRKSLCQKIGLRCKTPRLKRIAYLANDCFAAHGGQLSLLDGQDSNVSNMVKPGEVKFILNMPKILRSKTRRSKGHSAEEFEFEGQKQNRGSKAPKGLRNGGSKAPKAWETGGRRPSPRGGYDILTKVSYDATQRRAGGAGALRSDHPDVDLDSSDSGDSYESRFANRELKWGESEDRDGWGPGIVLKLRSSPDPHPSEYGEEEPDNETL